MLHLILLSLLLAPGEGVSWERDYKAAFEKAVERNVPVFLAFNMDGEGANDSTARSIYQDPEFVERSRDFVCLIASSAKHEARAETVDGAERQVCARFGSVTCEEHLKVEIRASEEFIGRDTVIAPQHLLITPSRRLLARKAYQASKDDLFKMMTLAEKELARLAGNEDQVEAARLRELKELALERNSERRGAAIVELGRMSNLEAHEMLFSLTDAENMDATRMEAIDALAVKGNYDALPVLSALLKDKSSMIVKHAIVALEKLELPIAVPDLMKLWKKNSKSTIAKEIPRAIARCAPDDPEVRESIYKAAKASQDSAVEESAIVAMAALKLDEEGIEILADKLKARSGNTRGLATWALGSSKLKEAAPILEKAKESETNANVRECMEAALRNLQIESGPDDPDFANMLRRFIEDDVER
ncbi:MAG: HEAT repeat domain-containing protein [Planctomycetes bacterium]|nr:HEAT repeat domain-containing protein [Planctomycetota bacterium]